jgi:hypothetical protein
MGGLFTGSTPVSLGTPTPGAEIFYTTDGTDPTPSSQRYTGPIVISSTLTLKARAFVGGVAQSAVVTAGFTNSADFNPRSVAGLRLWLRADAGAPTGYGDRWEDQSANHNDAGQSYGVAVPRIVTEAVNGLPVMRFDGSDAVAFSRITNIRSVFWVIREDASATDEYRFLLDDCCATNDFHGGYPRAIWYSSGSPSILNGQTGSTGRRSTARPPTGRGRCRSFPWWRPVTSGRTGSGAGTAPAATGGATWPSWSSTTAR